MRLFSILLTAMVMLGAAAMAQETGHRFAPGLVEPGIADIHDQLTQRGYNAGPPTRMVTPRLRRAISTYQRDAGLPVDGLATPELQNQLRFGPVVNARGAGGAAVDPKVSIVQHHLRRLGYDPGPIDGVMGPKTRAGIAAFQQANGLLVNPVADDALIEALARR